MLFNYRLFYTCIVSLLIICTAFLTLDNIYSQYYGFEVLNTLLHVISLSLFLLVFSLRSNIFLLFWFVFYFMYLFLLSLFVHSNDALIGNMMYLSLVFLFIVVLPSLSKDIMVNVKLQKFYLVIISLVSLVFIVVNAGVYFSEGFFLGKHEYYSVLSNPNIIGYLLYLGFSISWMLYDYYSKKIYLAFSFLYLTLSFILIPVITVYIAVTVYIFVMYLLNRSKITKHMLTSLVILLLVYMAFSLAETFEDWKKYLSLRDLLYVRSYDLILEKTWFGYGVNNWGYISVNIKNPHNFILYLLLSFGVIGFSIYVSHVCYLAIKLYKKTQLKYASNYNKHLFSQLVVHLLIMSSFVSIPGHYQDISVFLSIYYSLIVNGALYVTTTIDIHKFSVKPLSPLLH